MADLDGSWWWCLTHQRAEKYDDTDSPDRLGPFPDKDAAEHAVQTMAERDKAYDKEDQDWDDGDDK